VVRGYGQGLPDIKLRGLGLAQPERSDRQEKMKVRFEEVGATVAFLFSEGAGYITGQVISVNGGLI